MRHLAGVGVEYGTEWVIAHLLQSRLTPIDGEEIFETLLDECYPEVKIGSSIFSPSQVDGRLYWQQLNKNVRQRISYYLCRMWKELKH